MSRILIICLFLTASASAEELGCKITKIEDVDLKAAVPEKLNLVSSPRVDVAKLGRITAGLCSNYTFVRLFQAGPYEGGGCEADPVLTYLGKNSSADDCGAPSVSGSSGAVMGYAAVGPKNVFIFSRLSEFTLDLVPDLKEARDKLKTRGLEAIRPGDRDNELLRQAQNRTIDIDGISFLPSFSMPRVIEPRGKQPFTLSFIGHSSSGSVENFKNCKSFDEVQPNLSICDGVSYLSLPDGSVAEYAGSELPVLKGYTTDELYFGYEEKLFSPISFGELKKGYEAFVLKDRVLSQNFYDRLRTSVKKFGSETQHFPPLPKDLDAFIAAKPLVLVKNPLGRWYSYSRVFAYLPR